MAGRTITKIACSSLRNIISLWYMSFLSDIQKAERQKNKMMLWVVMGVLVVAGIAGVLLFVRHLQQPVASVCDANLVARVDSLRQQGKYEELQGVATRVADKPGAKRDASCGYIIAINSVQGGTLDEGKSALTQYKKDYDERSKKDDAAKKKYQAYVKELEAEIRTKTDVVENLGGSTLTNPVHLDGNGENR